MPCGLLGVTPTVGGMAWAATVLGGEAGELFVTHGAWLNWLGMVLAGGMGAGIGWLIHRVQWLGSGPTDLRSRPAPAQRNELGNGPRPTAPDSARNLGGRRSTATAGAGRTRWRGGLPRYHQREAARALAATTWTLHACPRRWHQRPGSGTTRGRFLVAGAMTCSIAGFVRERWKSRIVAYTMSRESPCRSRASRRTSAP